MAIGAQSAARVRRGLGTYLPFLSAIAILAVGAAFCAWFASRAESDKRAELLLAARLLADQADPELIGALTGTEADLGGREYRRVKDALGLFRASDPRYRFVYLLGRRPGGPVLVLADSEPPSSVDYSPPGQAYPEVTAGHLKAFEPGGARVVGPASDRWGTWISALAPLPRSFNASMAIVVGADVDAAAWRRDITRAALVPAAIFLALAALPALYGAFAARGTRRGAERPPRGRRLEPALAACFGAVAALFAAWTANEVESRGRSSLFSQLAAARIAAVAERLRDIGQFGLDGLSGIYEQGGSPGREAFQRLAEHLARRTDVAAWEWIPAVPAAARRDFERMAAADGRPGFEIWHRDIQGERAPSAGRETYFPVLDAAPPQGNEAAIGYDLGSERTRRAALEEAARTGLVSASEPLVLVQEDRREKSVLLLRPVFERAGAAPLRGFAAAVLRMRTFIEGAAAGDGIDLSISFLREGAPPEPLATRAGADPSPSGGLAISAPVAAYGRVFSVTAAAGPAFAEKHRLRAGLFAGTGTLALVAAVVALVSVTFRRRGELELVVEERTRELKQSEQSYRNQFANNSAVMLLVDPSDGRILDANGAAAEFYGYGRERLLSMSLADLVLDSPEEILTRLGAVMDGTVKRVQSAHRRADGSLRDVEVSASLILSGDRVVIHAIVQDVTERVKAEDGLKHALDRLSLATRASGVGIWEYDATRGTEVWDDQMYRLYGTRRERFQDAADAWRASVHPDDLARQDREVRLALLGEREFDTEFRILRPDGELRFIRSIAIVQRDPSGRPLRMIGTNWDITEQKRSEEALRETNRNLAEASRRAEDLMRQAESANAAKSDFLATMSHEIRTPMNGIIGMADLLLGTELTAEQRQFARVVRTSGDALLVLINDILDFSKIEAGRLELETTDFHLRVTIEDSMDILRVKALEKGLELSSSIDPDVSVNLRGDPSRLRQVLINLAGNAIKFTPRGSVSLRTRLVCQDEARETLRFEVADTGIGIPQDRQAALFSPFIQVDSSTTRKYGGTGLGLAISRQLAELMGGTIGLESEEGEGSTFWFTAVFEKRPEGILSAPADPLNLSGLKVLVLDANDGDRLLVASLLSSWGCRHEQAVDGAAALLRLEAAAEAGDPFRVILADIETMRSDWRLPGSRLRELGGGRLVVMAAPGRRGDPAGLEGLAPAGHLAKPIRQSKLRECLALAVAEEDAGLEPLPEAEAAPRTAPVPRDARILLAEDNATNQYVALKILEKLGYAAEAVDSGSAALEVLADGRYDLVLMDCQMPGMDGFEATRRLRELEAGGRRTPVIAMTANALVGDRERCLGAGMDDYLSKPIDPGSLAGALARWLPATGAAADPAPDPSSLRPHDSAPGAEPRSKAAAEEGESEVLESLEPAEEEGADGTADLPAFDREAFLERTMRDIELARSLIEMFLGDLPGQLRAMGAAAAAGDCASAERLAHRMKGAAANMGAEALREAAGRMEAAGKAGEAAELARLVPDLERAFAATRAAMRVGP